MSASSLRRAIAALLTLAVMSTLAACSAASSTETASTTPIVSADCRSLFALPADESAPKVAIVSDDTASAGHMMLTGAAEKAVATASRANGTVSVLSIDGANAQPDWLARSSALNDSRLAADTSRHQRIVQLAPQCVSQLMATGRPKQKGSDVLGALQLAAHQLNGSGTLIAYTDGLANSGLLDFSKQQFGADPADIVSALAAIGQLPPLKGIAVSITGIGQVSGAPLNQKIVSWFVSVYKELCRQSGAASCSVSSGPTLDSTVRTGLPADAALPLPVFSAPVVDGKACVLTIGSAALFGGNSAVLGSAADVALDSIVDRMKNGTPTAEVDGYTTTFGDPGFNTQLSTERAQAVVSRLVQLGLKQSQLVAVGKGGSDPVAQPDHDANGPIESAASQNRRVEVRITGLAKCA
ncbi:MAG: OmpA family protein [Actinomycetota bacterium]